MKNCLLAFIFLSSELFGQVSIDILTENLHTYTSKNYVWAENKPLPDNFKNTVFTIFNDISNSFCTAIDSVPNYKDFHAIDIDQDNDLDIVFQGLECSGFESESVIIYLNCDGKFERRLHTSGKIIQINNAKDLTIYEYPCCAMTENSLVQYSIFKDKIELHSAITFFDSFLLHGKNPGASPNYDNIVPKFLKFSGEISIKEKAILNYLPMDSIIGGTYIKENFVASTSKKTSAKVFATIIDKSGSKWFYVKIPNQNIILDTKRLIHPVLVWVKEKYCS